MQQGLRHLSLCATGASEDTCPCVQQGRAKTPVLVCNRGEPRHLCSLSRYPSLTKQLIYKLNESTENQKYFRFFILNLACWTKLVFTKPILLTRKFGTGVNCFTSQTHKSSKSQQTDANVSTVLLHKYELFYFTCRLTSATFQQMDAIIHYFRHHTPSDHHLPIRSLSRRH